MKKAVKKLVYKVVGTALVKVARAISWINFQIEKADVAVGSLGMEMLDVANGVADDGVQ